MHWLAEIRHKGHDGKLSVSGQVTVAADTEVEAREKIHTEESGAVYEILSIEPLSTCPSCGQTRSV